MATRERREQRYGNERITLRQTLAVAVVLHLMLGWVMHVNPDLLFSEPVVAEPVSRPLEFRFVDVPETPTEETPDTEVMSDVDRVAADQSERDDAEDPFSEGNTPQEVLRSEPEPTPTPPVEPIPPSAVVPEPVAAATPETQPTTAEPDNSANTETPVSEATSAAETAAPPEATSVGPTPLSTAAPVLPPSRNTLRESLARGVQQYVEPEVFANTDGGAEGSRGLVSFDTKGYDLGPYITQVLRIIERNWKTNIPPAARWQGQDGAVFVNISIIRDAETGDRAVLSVTRSWSSGKPAFDQAALMALEISNPLPPLPSFFPFDHLDGRLGFLYNLDPAQVTFPSQR